MRLTKKLLSAFLALVMVFTMLPVQAFASETVSDGTRFDGLTGEYRPDGPSNAIKTEDTKIIGVGETLNVESSRKVKHSWTTSNASVATVAAKEQNGKATKNAIITGVAPGRAEIKDTGLLETNCDIFPIVVLALSLPESLPITGKQTVSLNLTRNPVDADVTVIWESSDTGVATVDAWGNVTSVGVGSATITAKVQSATGKYISAQCAVTVEEATVKSIALQELSLAEGRTGKMQVTYIPNEPLNPNLSWSMEEGTQIATIAEDGTITATATGETTVTVTYDGLTSSAKLTVTELVPESITLDKTELTIQGMQPQKLHATVLPEDADRTVTWTSTNPAAATVDETGNVQPVGLGKTTIVATTSNGLEARCDVTVEALPEEGNTPVYVYLKFDLQDGMQKPDGWEANANGWFTVGVLYVPSEELESASNFNINHTAEVSKATKYLGQISLWPEDSRFTSAIDLTNLEWNILKVENGAADYVNAGTHTWHLDGYYTIAAEKSTITVRYQDEYGNPLTPKNDPNTNFKDIKNGTEITIQYPQIENYTVSKFEGVPVAQNETSHQLTVVEDRTITITYKGNSNSYTVKYVDEKGKPIPGESNVTVDSSYGATIEVDSVLESYKKEIPNFTYNHITPSDSLKIENNPGLNVFTLHYTRNQHTVTYQYTNPVTGQEETTDPETKGAGTQVMAATAPDIDGYTFSGWQEVTNGVADQDKVTIGEDGTFTMPDRDVVFQGTFSVSESQKYAVRANIYRGNRGNGTHLDTVDKVNITWAQLQSYYNMAHYELANEFWNLNLNANSGLHEKHWDTSAKDAARIYKGGTGVEEFHIVHIYLKDNSDALVTLTYDDNVTDNSVTDMPNPLSKMYLKGTQVTVSNTVPTRENYTFKGWNTQKDGAGDWYGTTDDKETITLNENTTLYAVWERTIFDGTPITVKVMMDGQQENASAYVTVGVDEKGTPSLKSTVSGNVYSLSYTYEQKNCADFYLNKVSAEKFTGYDVRVSWEGGVNVDASASQKPTDNGWHLDNIPGGATVTVSLTLQKHTITYEAGQGGGVTLSTMPTVPGERVTEEVKHGEDAGGAKAVPNQGYYFVEWLNEKNEQVSANATFAPTGVTADATYTAVFAERNAITVTIAGSTVEGTYNGQPQTATGYTVTIPEGIDYTENNISFSGTAIAARTDVGTANMGLTAAQFTNTNDKYDVTFEVVDGSVTVKPAKVTVKADDKTKVYCENDPELTATVTGTIGTDTVTYTLSRDAGEDAGKYTITPDGDDIQGNYMVAYETGTLTITKAPGLTFTATGYSAEYDGEEHFATATSTIPGTTFQYKVGEGEWQNEAPSIKDVGSKSVTVKAINSNYDEAETQAVELKVTPKAVTVKAENKTKVYGENDPDLTATVSGTIGNDTVAYTVGRAEGENVGTYTITPSGNEVQGNYAVTYKTGQLTITPVIAEVVVPITGNTKTETYTGREQDVTGYSVGTIAIGDKATTLYTSSDFGLKSGVEAKASGTNVGTYYMGLSAGSFKNTSNNFSNVKFVVTDGSLTINKATMDLTAEGYNGKYDGQFHGGKVSGAPEDATLTYSTDGGNTWSDTAPTVKNVADGLVTVKVKATLANHQDAVATYTLKVNPRTVTLTSGSDTQKYNGTALTNDTVTVTGDGFVDGEGATYDVTGSQTLVGSSNNTFTYTLNEGTKETNYDITTVAGTLTVENRAEFDKYQIAVEAKSGEYTYDGQEKTVSGLLTDKFTVNGQQYTVSSLTAEGKGTDADEYDVVVSGTAVVTDANGNDVTAQFTVSTTDGTLTIKKRSVTLTSATDSKEYDGTALTNDTVTVTGDGFVDGEGATYEVTGSQTLVGTSKNTFDVQYNQGTLAQNYQIRKVEGDLTVTPPENLDEYVVKTHEGQNFKVGDTVTFKITVTNIYDVDATVNLEEMAGMTFGNGQTTLEDVLIPGQSKTYTATHTLTDADFQQDITNTAKVTLAPNGKNPIGGEDTHRVDLTPDPKVSITKTVENSQKAPYRIGDVIEYKITVTNTGNVPLHDLELTDTMNAAGKVEFPAGTALEKDSLAVGESWIVRCTYTVQASDEGKVLTNTAKVITHKPGGDPEKEAEVTTDGEQVQERYSLTIHYVNAAGRAVAGSYSARYHAGEIFKVESPIVAGYYAPQKRSISSDENGMPEKDLVYWVEYVAIPVPEEPTRPNPRPTEPTDETEDTTPTAPTEKPQQPPEPEDFVIDPDDDYNLTKVEDDETPLADLALDGHTCCIMHLLLMLAAMVVLGFDTKSRKKHQARIFELKKMLAMEEDHSDDPEQP